VVFSPKEFNKNNSNAHYRVLFGVIIEKLNRNAVKMLYLNPSGAAVG
jgi:hypothetical protein